MIAAEELTFAYRSGQAPVLNRFTYSFLSGVTVVGGPSGCGKSTLLYLLGLMLAPGTGRVVLDGTDVSSLSDAARSRLRASHVGFVFQDAALDPSRTVLDNVTEGGLYAGIPAAEGRLRARSLLQEFGVTTQETHRPGEISGGQAQRVALCRALLKRPRVILADEPTGNLDSDSADIVWSALYAAADAGTTVVVASHNTERLKAAPYQVRLP